MKWISRLLIAVAVLSLSGSTVFARSILEKKINYLAYTNKAGEAKYWVIFLGNYDCNLTRKYPGEGDVKVAASVNLQLLSSGYIEGNGYSAKGKIESLPTMLMSNSSGQRQIEADSVDFFYDEGRKVQLKNGEKGDLLLNIEGTQVSAKRFILREFKLTDYFGEQILKEGSEETALSALSYSKEGLARAQKAQNELGGQTQK